MQKHIGCGQGGGLRRWTTVVASALACAAAGSAAVPAAGGAQAIAYAPAIQLVAAPSVSVAIDHTCAVTVHGAAKCWGLNDDGQLGDGTYTRSFDPVQVKGLNGGVVAISASVGHTCAVMVTGAAKCWGSDMYGELGNNTEGTISFTTPVDVTGLSSGVVAISSGVHYTCARTSGGAAKCWGANYSGQVGDGTKTERATPVDVKGLSSGVAAISAGGGHTCALTSGGGAKCWGSNDFGQLGTGTKTDSSIPVDVKGLSSGVVTISAGGAHTCAVARGGAAKCWGRNADGELGDGSRTSSTTPVGVGGLSGGIAKISAAQQFPQACVVTVHGGAKCWGLNNFGQLGTGNHTSATRPVDVKGLATGVTKISAGGYRACATMRGGGVKWWGQGPLGVGGTSTPDSVSGL